MKNSGEKRYLLLLTTVALGTMLNPLNSSMIAIALARLQEEFHLTFSDASWLISTYYLASGIGQPVMGKLSDIYGQKRLFLWGLFLIAAASLLAPLSPNFGWLLVFRIVQAIGSSTLFPAGMGIVRRIITTNQAKALGVLSIFSSTSAAFGPSVGGFLLHFGDWPAVFLINLPFILSSFILAIRILPKDSGMPKQKARIDLAGVALFSAMIISWLLFLLSLEQTVNWWMLIAGILLAGFFYKLESTREDPFIDVKSLRKNVNVTLIYAQFILVNTIFYSVFFGVPSYLQNVHHFDAKNSGLMMLSIAGFGVIITPLVGRWIDRSGAKPALTVGAAVLTIGVLLMLSVHDQTSAVWMFLIFSVLGISNGFNNLSMQSALYAHVEPSETGTASGLFMTSRYIGTILSSSLLGVLFGKQITTAHFHEIAVVCAVIAAIVLMLTIRMPNAVARQKAGSR
ncbi:MFS transporter [Effusibacillus dendaii]|uniref:Putative MFS-type transporter YwoD n=1 Tax=Effusibacillus dendaii TaxID=2743772 RepID=A0A7I8DBL8_9BACL|nr:MFS transporter [Effusibacillus dendaii]BCJ87583.1 putative MFS-type transporter YwoD [Effusibacillus dendaii]